MRKLLTILAFAVSSAMMAEGTAMLISDSKQVQNSWSWNFNVEFGLKIHFVTSCYDCNLTSTKGMSSDVQRILSNKNISVEKPNVIFLQLGCNDKADSKTEYESYEKSLFDFPYGTVCNLAGANVKTKNIAVSKDNTKITNRNFAGSYYRIVDFIRKEAPDTRIFIVAPVNFGKTHSADDSIKLKEIKEIANMFCIPFVENFDIIKDYDFIWKKTKPNLGKVLLLGDSYCQYRKWTAQFARLSSVEITNLGVASATIKERSSSTNNLANQLKKIPSSCKPNTIILQGGINDEADQQRFVDDYGTCIKELKRGTFAGALAYLVKNLRGRFPNVKIYVITPSGLYYGHTDKPFDFIVKANQIRKAAKLIGIPTINWDREGRLSFVFNNSKGAGSGTESDPFRYNIPSSETGDLLHPNEVGGTYLAENVIKELASSKLK